MKYTVITITTVNSEYKYIGKRLMQVIVEFSERRLLSEIVNIKIETK